MRFLIAIFFILTIGFSNTISAQDEGMETRLFVDVQWYPAGFIYEVGTSINPFKNNSYFTFKLGYNAADRKDFAFDISGHNNEEGGGVGLSLGYEYMFGGKIEGAFAGIRTDLWQMEIDWEIDGPPIESGMTNIIVFQPVLELGYQFNYASKFYSRVFLGLGREINIKTEGEPVGEGGITLVGFQTGMKF